MAGYDWALLADRGGEAVESVIATMLLKRHPGARQVNPSQGDGGIDVILETEAGIEVWQVKKFTSPVTASQSRQIKKSWRRFENEHVKTGKLIVAYHLVTPWTPTEERISDLQLLVGERPFPYSWEGEAFINGLADENPMTIQRFAYGPDAAARLYVNERAMIAGSPVERGGSLTMLAAAERRREALDEVVNTVSDHYWIDTGTRTVATDGEPPLPAPDDPAVYHRMKYLGNNRWSYESVVPRTADSGELDPIRLGFQITGGPGSSEHEAMREWMEWGTPPQNLHVRTFTRGGPHDGDEHEEAILRVRPVGGTPAQYLVLVLRDAATREELARRILDVEAHTAGMRTGWIRLFAQSPGHLIAVELKYTDDSGEAHIEVGDVDGLSPSSVMDDFKFLSLLSPDVRVTLETKEGTILLSGDLSIPSDLAIYYAPVARGLVSLQRSTNQPLLMPNVLDMTLGELETLENYARIYEGSPYEWVGKGPSVTIPEEEPLATEVRQFASEVIANRGVVAAEQPEIKVANRTYVIERHVVTTIRDADMNLEVDIGSVLPGETFRLFAGDKVKSITAAVMDWAPES